MLGWLAGTPAGTLSTLLAAPYLWAHLWRLWAHLWLLACGHPASSRCRLSPTVLRLRAYLARPPGCLQAKKPLSVMHTLGTMLLPRLQPGEPDRDFAQGGWVAGGAPLPCPAAAVGSSRGRWDVTAIAFPVAHTANIF